jgi:hypothetical protein
MNYVQHCLGICDKERDVRCNQFGERLQLNAPTIATQDASEFCIGLNSIPEHTLKLPEATVRELETM